MTNELRQASDELGKELCTALKKELQSQGHRATGKLIESIEYEVRQYVSKLEIEISYLDYGLFVETGRRIGARGVPIKVLLKWMEVKGIVPKKGSRKALAFAIQRKIIKEGIPTRNSYQFSSNGRRKEFQTQIIKEKESLIYDRLGEMATIFLNDLIYGMIKEIAA